jgi:predicted RNA-binding Zn ribbon-like protein
MAFAGNLLRETAMEPGGRQPAPGALRLVQEFLNSVDLEDGGDAFARPDGLAAWLAARGLQSGPPTLGEEERRRAVALREALRAVVATHGGGGRAGFDPAAAATLSRLAGASPLVVAFDAGGTPSLRPAAPGVDGALGVVLATVRAAEAEGTWPRLKTCARDPCRWVFYDRSRNCSSRWCAMSVCGTREKMAAYRDRRVRGPSAPPGERY